MIAITELSMSESMPGLDGARIETPRPGDRLGKHVVEVRGWLVGRSRPAVAGFWPGIHLLRRNWFGRGKSFHGQLSLQCRLRSHRMPPQLSHHHWM